MKWMSHGQAECHSSILSVQSANLINKFLEHQNNMVPPSPTALASPQIETLVLDAAPLLLLTPLRGLAKRYFTTPQVVAELKDKRAREHWEQLAITQGVEVVVRNPGVLALSKVTAFSKKSGDYSVLSHPDLCVLALTLELDELARLVPERPSKATTEEGLTGHTGQCIQPLSAGLTTPGEGIGSIPAGKTLAEQTSQPPQAEADASETLVQQLAKLELNSDTGIPLVSNEGGNDEALEAIQEPLHDPSETPLQDTPPEDSGSSESTLLYDDPSTDDDGEGEWITPANVNKHKEEAKQSQAVFTKEQDASPIAVACMTADFAMQNVLLQMGLDLVGVEGKRIAQVRSTVLRCHACFKICKDSSKKFCPSCGNPTLLRVTVTTHAATVPGEQPAMKIHLKKNFQWRTRGTKFSLPTPKMGHAKGGGETSMVLREDQQEWERGLRREAVRERKQEKRLQRAIVEKEKSGGEVWRDPDWIPDLLVGAGRNAGGMPLVGHGKRNPNESKKKRK